MVAYTRGPGLAGALLVGAGVACALGAALGKPVLGVHHLEGHLLSPFLSADPPEFPFVALLVSGGHTQLMRVDGVGPLRAARRNHRRCGGRSLRQVGQADGPGLSRRAGAVAAGGAGRSEAFKLPRPLHAQRRPRLLVRRPQDRRPHAGEKAGPGTRSAQGRSGRLDPGGHRRSAGEEVDDGAGAIGPAAPGRCRRRGREQGVARASSMPLAPSAACACTIPSFTCAPTTAP